MRNATTDRALNLIEENADTPRIINFSESANALDREAANVSPPESVRTRRFSPSFHYPSLFCFDRPVGFDFGLLAAANFEILLILLFFGYVGSKTVGAQGLRPFNDNSITTSTGESLF